MRKELLPIGTIVLLEGGIKKVMITGYSSKNKNSEKIYDYNGCVFPEGLIENIFCLFDSNQIAEIIYKGLDNDEFKEFVKRESSKISLSSSSKEVQADKRNLNSKNFTKKSSSVTSLSSSEMHNRFATEKISGIQTEKIDFSNL